MIWILLISLVIASPIESDRSPLLNNLELSDAQPLQKLNRKHSIKNFMGKVRNSFRRKHKSSPVLRDEVAANELWETPVFFQESFILACKNGKTSLAAKLIAKDNTGLDNHNCLRIAVKYGQTDIVKMLLDIDASSEPSIFRDHEAIFSAIRNDHTDIFLMLINSPKLLMTSNELRLVLDETIKINNPRMVAEILSVLKDKKIPFSMIRPIKLAVAYKSFGVFKFLIHRIDLTPREWVEILRAAELHKNNMAMDYLMGMEISGLDKDQKFDLLWHYLPENLKLPSTAAEI